VSLVVGHATGVGDRPEKHHDVIAVATAVANAT